MLIEVSNGELIDKISILLIKLDRIEDLDKLSNIKFEHLALLEAANKENLMSNSDNLNELRRINEGIWDAEEKVRVTEDVNEIKELTKTIYTLNDERAVVKKKINVETRSSVVEEKSYKGM